MVSRRQKLAQRIVDALKEKAYLNSNPGPLIREFTRTRSHKDRKVKGHVEARLIDPRMKWKDVREEVIEPEKFWDDWQDRRDGMRNWMTIEQWERIQKEKAIRKAKLERLKH